MERSADWMAQARSDLRHARQAVQGGFYDWACFSAQQAAEKAVKAVFQRLGAEAWGHAVAKLLEELAKVRAVPEPLIDLARELDKAYVGSRYPNAHVAGSPSEIYVRAEAERSMEHAQRIIGFCEDLLAAF